MTAVPETRVSGVVTRSRAARAVVPVPRASGIVATPSVSAGIHKRKKPASASEGAGKALSEASEILKLKKEAVAATRLWREMGVPGALERWVKAREEEVRAEEEAQPKRKKMVLKTRLPETVINVMKLHPYCSTEHMADEDLANQTESFRERYTMVRLFDEKMNAYEQALVKQYDCKGYAEDETEVSCDGQEI